MDQSLKKSRLYGNKHFAVYLSLFVSAAFFCVIHHFSGCDTIFQYDFDEGFYFIRAFLHLHGFDLYKDIAFDQPPVLPKLIYFAFKWFGPSIGIARSLVLLITSLMLGSIFYIIYRTQNIFSALLTMVLICSVPHFIRLSVSGMNGLPAIAFSIMSCVGIYWYQVHRKVVFLALSALFLALGLQTKLFVFMFIPAIAVELFTIEYKYYAGKIRPKHFLSLRFWALCLLAVYLSIAWCVDVDYVQIVSPYLLAGKHFPVVPYVAVLGWITDNLGISLLCIGSVLCFRKGSMSFYFAPLILAVSGFVLFSHHAPIWSNHRMLMMIPAAWFASFAIHYFFTWETWRGIKSQAVQKKCWTLLKLVLIGFALGIVMINLKSKAYTAKWEMDDSTPREIYDVIDLINKNKTEDTIMVADAPNFAFHTQVLIPPSLGTFSYKHVEIGLISEESLVGVINRDKVDMIVWYRFPKLGEKVMGRVGAFYELVYRSDEQHLKLYFRKK